ncbi:sacsin N-terminal ATP-binding-like domain-containing protein [Actinomycetospora termitidis]|uniref:Molecular chaperone Hsp90 n=1 Tax=Actinomycetospora termitidis TaxID=3053470 RepID=A0ABT7M4Z0_9PSEU|nr:hypothetical protein [Actinomycetospora sp. Odt1-22]MDL5155753.1 hypothetical protein [Actinomycetospora sp. Odt1-22]
MGTPDPFGTAALRRAVLDTWAASPARFREDANAEEDLVRGGYRGRWFVELAQNAADAGAAAGEPTRLRVTVHGDELRVGNTGAPLDAAGVAGLASLRASAKRTGATVGRFGVGFSAVLGLTDAPRVVTRDGGVAFDRARTVAAVTEAGGELAEEARRRGPDGVPVLRLPWPADDDLDDDLVTTEVRLPLTVPADDALREVRDQARDLLLALPWLGSVEVDGRTLERVDEGGGRLVVGGVGWTTLPCAGDLPAEVLREGDGSAALGVEDRERTTWEGLWAVRDAPGGPPRDTLHAPTATAETTTLPARLVVTVPLDADRRHVRRGRVTDHVLRAASAHYPDLVVRLDPDRRTALVPAPGLPASEVDATLREAVPAALGGAPWLPGAAGPDVVPSRAVALDDPTPGLLAALADTLDGLTSAPFTSALGDLGVTRLDPAALADRLVGLRRPPSWWHGVYEALAGLEALDPAELAALPVPLVDGRLVIGARGVLLPGPDVAQAGLGEGLDLRLVHSDAAHPLLVTLGARRADGPGLLDEPEVREAVERSVDDADAGLDVGPIARLVLTVVGERDPGAGPGFGALALPDDDGGYRRADELVLPDGALRAVLGDDSPIGVLADRAVAEHGREALRAVGVLDGFAIVLDDEPTGPDHDLDDEETWWAEAVDPEPAHPGADTGALPGPPSAMTAVRDLDLVADWPAAWPLLAGDRAVRAALVGLPGEPVPYTAWWLARHGDLAGHRPGHWRLPGATGPVAALVDPVPVDLDPGFLTAVGVRSDLTVADPDEAADLLDRLADPARTVPPGAALAAHSALADAVVAGRVDVADVDPPVRVRTADGSVVDADPARDPVPVVLDRPWLSVALDPGRVVPVAPGAAATLADLLDLPVASETVHGEVRSPGTPTAWTALADAAAWAAAVGWELPDGEVVVHERLRVAVSVAGEVREVFGHVWVTDDGTVHTDDPARALLAARSP